MLLMPWLVALTALGCSPAPEGDEAGFARAHGGEARCLPREGGGTVFEVVLGA